MEDNFVALINNYFILFSDKICIVYVSAFIVYISSK